MHPRDGTNISRMVCNGMYAYAVPFLMGASSVTKILASQVNTRVGHPNVLLLAHDDDRRTRHAQTHKGWERRVGEGSQSGG